MEPVKSKYQTAKEKVEKIKGFYHHLMAYLVINVMLVLIRIPILRFISNKGVVMDEGFFNWLDLNMLLTPVLWGIALAAHALYVFKFNMRFLRDWEERKIKELMKQDEYEAKKYK